MNQSQNNKEIFIQAYNEYSDAIFRYCVFRVYDREKAKELMQETFTKTWEYIEKGNQIENIKAFLYKVAHNTCVNEIIKNKAFSLDEMNEEIGFEPEDKTVKSPEKEAEINMLMDKMRLLKEKERDLLVMRYVNDLKVSEIARILKMLPNTVSIKISRAENALRNLYQKDGK